MDSARGVRSGGLTLALAWSGSAIAAIAVSTAVLRSLGADLTLAVSVLLFVVFGVSVFGYLPGLIAAVTSFAVLTYFFTPPLHSFAVDRTDDLIALLVFVAIAIVVATTVARLNELRNRSDVREREARLRLRFTNRLSTGADPGPVLEAATHDLVELFGLASCEVASTYGQFQVGGEEPDAQTLELSQRGLSLALRRARPFSTVELDTVEALVISLATVLERVRLDAEAREHRVRGEIARSRAGFLTAITHDLRTPLATIKTSTGALLMPSTRLDQASRRELLELAHDESARLERMVTNVLEMSRIRAGALQPQPLAMSVADVVRAAVERLGAAGDGQVIDLDVNVEIPAVWADPGMLERVISNLLENSLDHGRDRPVEVRAGTHDAVLELRIVDHGTGIPARDRDRIFEEFVRLDDVQSHRGTGLGLAIVHALVKASGGCVWCEETPGGGATFVVTLPIAAGNEP